MNEMGLALQRAFEASRPPSPFAVKALGCEVVITMEMLSDVDASLRPPRRRAKGRSDALEAT